MDKKIKSLEQVKEFHETFNAPVLDKPQIPSKERCMLKVSLLQEELNELKTAIDNDDLVEVGDALADLQYVLNGAILEFGFGDIIGEIIDEVHRSNMSKSCDTEEQAKETVEYYKEKGVEVYYQQSGDKFNIYRKEDDKILKNKYYSSANLKELINK